MPSTTTYQKIYPNKSTISNKITKKSLKKESSKLPTSIYNLVFDNLLKNNQANVIIHKLNNKKCIWNLVTYRRENNSIKVIHNKILTDCNKLKGLQKLYKTLNIIEKNCNSKIAEKYLLGYLEHRYISIEKMNSYEWIMN